MRRLKKTYSYSCIALIEITLKETEIMLQNQNFSQQQTLRQFLNLTSNSDYAKDVAEHWLSQSPPQPGIQYVLAIVVFAISVPSQVCQILVIFAYLR